MDLGKIKNFFIKLRYKKDKVYSITLAKIKIQKSFLLTPVGKRKWKYKLNFYRSTGNFQSEIILNYNFVLIDGYSSYLIAKKYGIKTVKVRFQ